MARKPTRGPVVIPNCAEIVIEWVANEVTFSNVLHSQLVPTGPIDPNVAESIFSGIKAAGSTTAWLAQVHPETRLTKVIVKDLRAANNPGYESTGISTPGTATGTPLSQGTAMCITLRTARSGRGFVGRVYLGGLASGVEETSRNFLSTACNLGVQFVTGVQSVITPLLGSPVLAQRALDPDPDNPNPAMTQPRAANTVPIVLVNFADTRIDSQRKRLGR